MEPAARIKEANREQLSFEVIDYDELIPLDHPARILVLFVEQLDLTSFYEGIKSREGSAGRSAIDPKLLLCLWLYSTVEGIGSARLLERLCDKDNVFRWLCGGVRVNYHTLSDFRSNHGEKLDDLLTDIISACLTQGLVKLKTLILDGTKIKANASKKSFKTRKHLTKLRKRTKAYVTGLRQELEHDPEASQRRVEAARSRAQADLEKRMTHALEELPELEATKASRKTKEKKGTKISEAKASVSDSDARLMTFADKRVKGGYNCQVGMDPDSFLVLSVDISQRGNDAGLLTPMIEQIESRYNARHERVLVDSSYQVKQDILDLAEHKTPTLVYSPLPKKRGNIKTESLRKREKKEANYPEGLKAFYRRMENKVAQKYYKLRSKIETFNAILHNRMQRGFHLRGKENVKAELLLQVIAHNILTLFKIGAQVGLVREKT